MRASSLHEGSAVNGSIAFASPILIVRASLRHVVGSGAIESRSYGCVTLHAVGPGARSRTIMPHARGVAPARRDPPETRRRCATKEEDGRAPRIAAGECCRWQFLSMLRLL